VAKSKEGPEHKLVGVPLLDELMKLGWAEDQVRYDPEWKVPKNPSQASKREAGGSFDGFPADLVIFDTPETYGEWQHVLVLFELKAPNKTEGRNQLEIMLSLEPRARLGYWSNGTESLSLYRRVDGTYKEVQNQPLPGPLDNLSEGASKPLTYATLKTPDAKDLRARIDRLLGAVVAADTKATRSEERLNQLCNVILVKLESDRLGKAQPDAALKFQVSASEKQTADAIKLTFATLRAKHPELFVGPADQELNLDDHTIQAAVYELSPIQLMDAPVDAVSQAFQVFRAATLKEEDGQYFTPPRIISAAVAFVDVAFDDKIVDPACGTGGFLFEAFASIRKKHSALPDADLRTWAHDSLYGVDKDSINVKLTKAIMAILGDGSTHVFKGDSIRSHRWAADYPQLVHGLKEGSFTCAITNPPFGAKLKVSKSDAKAGKYTIAVAAAKKGPKDYAEVEIGLVFLERCYKLLMVGGRMGIVLPETYFFSPSYAWLLGWLDGKLVLRGMLNIPMEAFQGFCRAKTNLYVFEKVG